jgi:hypothetical protein
MMVANGTITRRMHEAACIFRRLFRSAALDGMATTQLVRLGSAPLLGAEDMGDGLGDHRKRQGRVVRHDDVAHRPALAWSCPGQHLGAPRCPRSRQRRPTEPWD